MGQAFKITYQGDLGPWTDKKQYHQFSLLVLDPQFPSNRSIGVKYKIEWVKDKLAFDIDSRCLHLVDIQWPSFLETSQTYTFGIYVYDHEIATMIKLAYS
jgi:hypothetical protein